MAYGMYLLNPKTSKSRKSRRRGARRRKTRSFSTPNPMKKSRRKRRSFARRNPARRRRARRAKRIVALNPRRRRRRFSRMNPSRSRRRRVNRRSFSRRNPSGDVIGTFTSSDMLTTAAGVITATLGANLVVNKLATSPSTQKLPGLDPAKPSAMARTIYKGLIAGGTGFLLRNKAPRFAEGLMLGAVAVVGADLLAQSGLLTQLQQAAGVNRYYGPSRGTRAYLPGTPSILTGPGSAFLNRSSAPMARRPGMGAPVNRSFLRSVPGMVENPFN